MALEGVERESRVGVSLSRNLTNEHKCGMMGGEGGADRQTGGHTLTVHPQQLDRQSQMEMLDGLDYLVDPERAHAAAGDTGAETSIPGTCILCRTQEIARQEAEKAQQEVEDGRP